MICKNCGIEINDDSKFCVACGAVVEQPEEAPVQEAQPVAAEPVAAQPVYQQPIYQQPVYQESPDKKEITVDDLPDHLKPIGAWGYFGLRILFAIPLVGFVFLIVFSFSRGNLNRRSFARSYWCALIFAAIFLICFIFAAVLGISQMDMRYFM